MKDALDLVQVLQHCWKDPADMELARWQQFEKSFVPPVVIVPCQ